MKRIPTQGESEWAKSTLEEFSRADLSRVQSLWNPNATTVTRLKEAINDTYCDKFLKALKTPLYDEDRIGVKNATGATCEWIWKNPEFGQWRDAEDSRTFHLQGKPASGKSVLAKKVLQELSKIADVEPSTAILYHFCNNRRRPEESASNFLKSFLYQFFHSPQGKRRFSTLIGNCSVFDAVDLDIIEAGGLHLSLKSLWKVFKTTVRISGLSTLYLVLDALDECEKSSALTFLSRLPKLMSMKLIRNEGPIVRLFLTSRIDEEILNGIVDSSPISIQLSPDVTRDDIDSVVKENLSRLNRKLKMTDEQEESLRKTLVERSEGMFLWALLSLKEMEKCRGLTPEKMKSIIESSPLGLRQLYDRILEDLVKERPAADEVLALYKILAWVAGAARPLTLEELRVAIALRPEDKSMKDIAGRRVFSIECEVQRIPFLEIVDAEDGPDEFQVYHLPEAKEVPYAYGTLIRASTVRLVHQSAKEYLLEYRMRLQEIGQPSELRIPELGHAELASLCITFLKFEDFNTGPLQSRGNKAKQSTFTEVLRMKIKSYDFLEYAASFWAYHLNKLPGPDEELAKFVCTFICDAHNNVRFWVQVVNFLTDGINTDTVDDYFGLHVVAGENVPWMVKYLIDRGDDLEKVDAQGRTAYFVARIFGSEESEKLLLEAGADEWCPWEGSSDHLIFDNLHEVAISGVASALKGYLEAGADPEVVDKVGRTVAHYACASNNVDTVRTIITAGGNMSAKDLYGRTPLDLTLNPNARELIMDHLKMLITFPCESHQQTHTCRFADEPKCYEYFFLCDECGRAIEYYFYHNFDVCKDCWDSGARCFDDQHQPSLRILVEGMMSWVEYTPQMADMSYIDISCRLKQERVMIRRREREKRKAGAGRTTVAMNYLRDHLQRVAGLAVAAVVLWKVVSVVRRMRND
ncbi:hypothetical protein K440DRAFT_38350 [Wilcoxina mikolae CBS 423.85]|nr:hypothetical protein K440DRAFT_38350 [Wilcoxina mikolae CBS 423.85]